jgi:hypothetical protein
MSRQRAAGRSPGEWDRLVDEWKSSEQTQAAFAAAHGINAKTFQGRVWRSNRRRGYALKKADTSCRFVEVTSPPPIAAAERGGCRITMSKTEIEFASSSEAEWVFQILSKLGHGK